MLLSHIFVARHNATMTYATSVAILAQAYRGPPLCPSLCPPLRCESGLTAARVEGDRGGYGYRSLVLVQGRFVRYSHFTRG